MLQTYIFDLDNTLYHPSCGILPMIGVRIREYIRAMGFDHDEGERLRDDYWKSYGISLIGLMKYHDVDPVHFADFIYDIDYNGSLEKDVRLDAILDSLDGDKIIYTNAAEVHARRVLDRLGIGRHFSEIIAIEHTDYAAKPMPESYERLIASTGIDPTTALFFDDMPRNLLAAKEFGFATALVGEHEDGFDCHFPTIHDIADFDFGRLAAAKTKNP